MRCANVRLRVADVFAVADEQAREVLRDFDKVDLGTVGTDLVLAVWSEAEDLLHDMVEHEERELPAIEPIVPSLQGQK